MPQSGSNVNAFIKGTVTAFAIAFGAPVGAESTSHNTSAGDLQIENAFARETLPNQPVAGAFMTVTNAGNAPDRLIGGTSTAAGRIEIHEMAMQGDVMKMRALEAGLDVPAGETVELKPGGYHVMMFDLSDALKEGDTISLTLEFANAGEVTVPVVVHGKSAKNAHGAHGDHNSHGNHDTHGDGDAHSGH